LGCYGHILRHRSMVYDTVKKRAREKAAMTAATEAEVVVAAKEKVAKTEPEGGEG